MSGFVGILNLDGAPVDRVLVECMTQALAFRGPDGQAVWCEGALGLGHAMLRATRESAAEKQPGVLDDRLYIVADARVDARSELIDALNAEIRAFGPLSLATPDSLLILHAYNTWGEACVEKLLGDFSFAIWDTARRRLFCARDHFGVKPFFYMRSGNAVVFSNTLDTLRLYPGFSPVLCDAAIADFLIFNMNLHITRTPFEHILRLPAAHKLVAAENELHSERYWSFPIEEPLRYRRSRDFVDHFRELLDFAVGDRLRCDRASFSLSGGLDSPAVAAVATEKMGASDKLLGMTYGFKHVIPDSEPYYARTVAEYLRIPNRLISIDDYQPFELWASPELNRPWPSNFTFLASMCDFMKIIANHGRVFLTGEGGDPGLIPSLSFYRGPRLLNLIWDVAKYTVSRGRHPRVGFANAWKRWRKIPPQRIPNYPSWLSPELESREHLRDRWNEMFRMSAPLHPFRETSYYALAGPHLSSFLENQDAGCTKAPVDVRHPFYDVRLQRFFLRLPVLPWCADKEIIRVAMRSRLPEAILRRPKCPLQADPTEPMLRTIDAKLVNDFRATPELERYVVRRRIPPFGAGTGAWDGDVNLRPIELNYWLSHISPTSEIP